MIREDNLRDFFKSCLCEVSDDGLVERYNHEGGCGVRAFLIYISCLFAEFDARGLDYSVLRSEDGGLYLGRKARLESKKVVLV